MSSSAVEEGTKDRLARRPWLTSPISADLEISFEFFPPASRAGWNKLCDCVEELVPLSPSFVSATYGAGGSERHRTIRVVETLIAGYGLDVAGHLTAVGATTAETNDVVDAYVTAGTHRIVALRGDDPRAIVTRSSRMATRALPTSSPGYGRDPTANGSTS